MTSLLIAVHVASCLVLILVVLLQAGRGADMGAAFGGSSSAMFGSGSSTNPLARMTTYTAVAFLVTALLLAVSSARRASVFDATPEPLAQTPRAESSAPVPSPAESAPPVAGGAPAAAPVAEAKPLTIPASPSASGSGTEAAPAAAAEATPPAAAEAAPAAVPAAPAAPATPPAGAESAPAAGQ